MNKTEDYQRLAEMLALDVMSPKYANQISLITCYNSYGKMELKFHILYHDCKVESCGGYNTWVLDSYN